MKRGREDVRVAGVETVYRGHYRVDRYRLRHRKFAGDWSGELSREVFERGHAAAVLPYDPRLDRVVLIEQFRPGPFAAGDDPWVLEIVAGIIEAGEEPADVARRECLEEAGLAVTAMERIGGFYPSAGACSEFVHLFVGRIEASAAGGLHGLQGEGEDIRVLPMRAEEAFAALTEGRVRTSPAFAALAWLAANRVRLRGEWP